MFTNVTFVRTNFNSHAHVERDAHGVKKQDITPISTHTLTWSVTDLAMLYVHSGKISTHTLTWSVTNSSTFVAFFGWISTHTLTWSVTFVMSCHLQT